MNRIKRMARLFAFICLIVLASIGVGIIGGIPLPMIKGRKELEKDKIELIEEQYEESDSEKR